MSKNLFIVFEGIDGSGCETQSKLLAAWLRRKGRRVLKLKYPDYSDPYGRLVRFYLNGRLKLTQDRLFLTHLINQMKDRELIGKNLADRSFVVSDRYFASNLAYNCDKSIPVDKALKVASVFKLPKPDIIFLLDTKPETAIKRKAMEKGILDITERNIFKLRQVSQTYKNLARKNIWSQWFVIDGNRPIDDIKADILKVLEHYVKW